MTSSDDRKVGKHAALAAQYGVAPAKRTGHTPKIRPPGEAQIEAGRHNRAMNPPPRSTVSGFMLAYAPETKDKVSRFNRQNNKAPRPAATYRCARRKQAKIVRSAT
jgi:hypothetical protein